MLFRQCDRTYVVDTPAKLNLFLEVLGKREDGFHEIETLMVSISLYDTLSFTEGESPEVRLEVRSAGWAGAHAETDSEPIPDGEENLCVRAARLLQQAAGVDRGVHIVLRKRIPAASGLAGGSSDAAATLVALNRLWSLGLSTEELIELAARLGSDVGFFVSNRSAAICRGRGERVEPIDVPQGMHFAVVRPQAGLATADVYRRCRPAVQPRSVEPLRSALERGRFNAVGRLMHNGLQTPAVELRPELNQLRSRFDAIPCLGRQMSGSGTAWYGVFAGRRQARRAAVALRAQRMGRTFAVQCRT